MMNVPYTCIAELLSKGDVIPFLGAAASIAGFASDAKRPPDGRQLAEDLMHFSDYPENEDCSLTKVAQFCEECVAGRTPLYERLRDIFYSAHEEMTPSPVARMLARVEVPLLIVTTNYDSNVELAFRQSKRDYSMLTHITNREHPKWGYLLVQRSEKPEVVEEIEPSDFILSEHPKRTIIYKIHGTFGHEEAFNPKVDTIIVTEDDYIKFLVMMELRNFPPALARLFQEKHFLFLGYSLADWNFRVILRKIQFTAELGQDRLSWAMQRNPSTSEQHFWLRRKVNLYDVDLAEFTTRMTALLESQL